MIRTLYHGTSEKNAKNIMLTGMLPLNYWSDDIKIARYYAKLHNNKGKILVTYVFENVFDELFIKNDMYYQNRELLVASLINIAIPNIHYKMTKKRHRISIIQLDFFFLIFIAIF
jgi:hypothetical protein